MVLLPAAALLAGSLNLNLGLAFLLWIGFSVLVSILFFNQQQTRWLDWLFAAIDSILALSVILLSDGLASPLWAGMIAGASILACRQDTIMALISSAAGMLLAGIVLILASPGTFGPIILWLSYLTPVLGSTLLFSRIAAAANASQGFSSEQTLLLSRHKQLDPYDSRKLFHLAAELNATLNYDRVIETTLELSAAALASEEAADDDLIGAVLLFDDDHLHIKAERGLTHADRRNTFPAHAGVLNTAVQTGNPVLIYDPLLDPELKRLVALHPCHQVLAIPLVAGLETYGVLLIAHLQPDYFAVEHIELMEAIGQQVIVALQNARLYRDLEQEKERIMKIEEEARHKLARDLHDGPTQSIAAIAMRVNFARRLVDRDADKVADELTKIEELARRTTKEIRHMLFTLRPLILESQGLIAALAQLADKLSKAQNQQINITAEQDDLQNLDLNKQVVLFYIAEEAVHNAIKHAHAQEINIRLHAIPDYFYLVIEDNGVGFNVGAVDHDYHQRGSLGMVNMRERTELLNGFFQLHSEEGVGTRITIVVPLNEESTEEIHSPGFSSSATKET